MSKLTDEEVKDLINELRDNIEFKDFIKAKFVLSFFDSLKEKDQKKILLILNSSSDEFGIFLLVYLLSENPGLNEKYPEIEEKILSSLYYYPELVIRFLTDKEIKDKTLFIRAAGNLQYKPAAKIIKNILNNAQKSSEVRLLIKTLGEIGDPGSVSDLSDYLYFDDNTIVDFCIDAMGKIASPEAIGHLSNKFGSHEKNDLKILKYFGKFQDDQSLKILNQSLNSDNSKIRNYAKEVLVKIGSKSVPHITDNLSSNNKDLVINSLNALGEIGDEKAIKPIRDLLNNMPEDSNIRFAAYEALSNLPLQNRAYYLAQGLTDPSEQVRIAAAKAVDNNVDKMLLGGIKQIVNKKNEESIIVINAIINARADKFFKELIGESSFQDLAKVAFSNAPKDVITHYSTLAKESNFNDFAESIKSQNGDKEERKLACVIDDSRMILNILKNTLYKLNFDAMTFSSSADALKWIERKKPDIVFTDLNMPEINGIEVTQKVRLQYDGSELPIVLITSRDDEKSNKDAYEAGINNILYKPFNMDKLKEVLSAFE